MHAKGKESGFGVIHRGGRLLDKGGVCPCQALMNCVIYRSGGHHTAAKFVHLVDAAGDVEEGEVECVVEKFQCYHTKDKKK
jgi:hypothetical protein